MYCEQYACAASLGRTRSVKENCARSASVQRSATAVRRSHSTC